MNQNKSSKKFLGIMFDCCNVYSRIYKNKTGTHYEGLCPRCRKKVSVRIGDGGSNQRFFQAK